MFRGQHVHAIDAKGRTSLPARFRSVLEERGDMRVFLVPGLDECIELHPWAEWIEFEDKLSKQPQFNPAVRKIQRLYVSGALDAEVDKLGRILIPKELRERAKLGREVLWAGMTKRIELWDRERFQAVTDRDLGTPEAQEDLKKALSELGM
ncbi:MAG TPA: division/cell wall cluster transcriptional repressor MraZ [Polyangiales bacterium]|nr:division/cell wall cluster transcriptional repressor MraZ [Polyangiales bacterium]